MVPLRPIVSTICSLTYNVAKHLAKVLQPFVGEYTHVVNDSVNFVNILKDQHISTTARLVSFDVEFLFTTVPQRCCWFRIYSLKML